VRRLVLVRPGDGGARRDRQGLGLVQELRDVDGRVAIGDRRLGRRLGRRRGLVRVVATAAGDPRKREDRRRDCGNGD
jgi:hypothetical protein